MVLSNDELTNYSQTWGRAILSSSACRSLNAVPEQGLRVNSQVALASGCLLASTVLQTRTTHDPNPRCLLK